MHRSLTRLFLAALFVSVTALAGTIVIDENGNGFSNGVPIAHTIGTDPGPGGLTGVLIYTLPFAGIQGDVLLNDAGIGVLDVLRFNGNGTVIFYSDNIDGFDAIGDTPSPPGSFYTNVITIQEVGPEGNNGATYTPTANQPGFDASNPTYTFISDGSAIPEPGSLGLMLAGLGALLYRAIRTKRGA